MKRTPLYQEHLKLNAKMVSFAGFEMPLRYSSILDEHRAVRTGVGIFDLSHMGEIRVGGPGAEAFLQQMTVNDVTKLNAGSAQYTVMCTEQGGIVDDCVLYRLDADYVLVVNAANIEKDFEWLEGHLVSGVNLENISDDTCLIAVQGPESKAVLDPLLDEPSRLDGLTFYHHLTLQVGGLEVLCSRTGYTGELGYEMYLNREKGPELWEILLEAGGGSGFKPVGLGARDTLRIEMKYCLFGNDIDETTNPIEAGLGWIVKLQKGSFLGWEAIGRIKSQGPPRKLIGFEMAGRTIPRKGYPILIDGRVMGQVTSGCHSPSLGKGIGMGYLPSNFAV
ncbi:MAG: glycine cleavage system aminomethyltransferase GcvT, partial [Fidelibacterota bacterium]